MLLIGWHGSSGYSSRRSTVMVTTGKGLSRRKTVSLSYLTQIASRTSGAPMQVAMRTRKLRHQAIAPTKYETMPGLVLTQSIPTRSLASLPSQKRHHHA